MDFLSKILGFTGSVDTKEEKKPTTGRFAKYTVESSEITTFNKNYKWFLKDTENKNLKSVFQQYLNDNKIGMKNIMDYEIHEMQYVTNTVDCNTYSTSLTIDNVLTKDENSVKPKDLALSLTMLECIYSKQDLTLEAVNDTLMFIKYFVKTYGNKNVFMSKSVAFNTLRAVYIDNLSKGVDALSDNNKLFDQAIIDNKLSIKISTTQE